MKTLKALPKEAVPVLAESDLPEGDVLKNRWHVTFAPKGDQLGQKHILVLYQGVWFDYSESFR